MICGSYVFDSFIHIYFVLAHDGGCDVAVVALYTSSPCETFGVRSIECAVGFHFDVAFTRCLRYLHVHLLLQRLILALLGIRHQRGYGCTSCNHSDVCQSTRLCLYCSGFFRVRISSCSSSTSIKKKAPPALILVWIAPEMSFSTLRVPNWVKT